MTLAEDPNFRCCHTIAIFLRAGRIPARRAFGSGVTDFGEAFRNVLKIVYRIHPCPFHYPEPWRYLGSSRYPPASSKSAIALSVIAAALNNLRPVVQKIGSGWSPLVSVLVHGLGFANVLAELGLPAGALAVALVSFNLGVESGAVGDCFPRFAVGVFLPSTGGSILE